MSSLALALEGSTHSGTVALFRDGILVGEGSIEATAGDRQSGRGEALVPLIDEILRAGGVKASELSAVICGAGPGSFTSLRVAASVAKGIVFASGARLYAVSSLLLTFGGSRIPVDDGSYVSVLPAMRGEVFALPVTLTTGVPAAAALAHSIVSEAELPEFARERKSRLIGPGQEIDASPQARGCAGPTSVRAGAAPVTPGNTPSLYEFIMRSGAVDIDTWEPDYGRLAEAQVKWEAAHGRPLRA
jgi:tRNA threonylcarbamoyladenosine biosynthesis protein TsaB